MENNLENNEESNVEPKVEANVASNTEPPAVPYTQPPAMPYTQPEITAKYLKSTTQIQGWLTFFLVVMILGGLVSAIFPIVTLNMADYNNSVILASGDIIEGILLLALAIYTLYAFIERKPDAVFSAKTYVVTAFSLNLFVLIISKVTDTDIDDFRGIKGIIRSLIWSVIWFTYLCLSEQVATVIPHSYRKIFKHNYIFIALLVLVPTLLLTWGFLSTKWVAASHQSEVEENLKNLVLQENERTDGVVVFTLPDGFECTETEVDGIKIFSLESDAEESVLFCVYDFDESESLFDDYWKASKNTELNKYFDKVESDEIRTINGYKYRYRLTRYSNMGSVFYWRYVAIYDNKKSKACLLTFYDVDDDTNFIALLNSLRFL